MPHSAGATPAIGAYEDQFIGNQRISVKAGLVPVFLDVISPTYLTRFSIEGVEVSRARTDKDNVSRNCGS